MQCLINHCKKPYLCKNVKCKNVKWRFVGATDKPCGVCTVANPKLLLNGT